MNEKLQSLDTSDSELLVTFFLFIKPIAKAAINRDKKMNAMIFFINRIAINHWLNALIAINHWLNALIAINHWLSTLIALVFMILFAFLWFYVAVKHFELPCAWIVL